MLILVTDRKAFGERLAAALFQRGVFLLRSSTETALFLCREKDCGGVLIDGTDRPDAAEQLCRDLRIRYPKMPISLLLEDEQITSAEADKLLRGKNFDIILQDALEFCTVHMGWREGPMTSFSLSVGSDPLETVYMGYPLRLSPREHVLLRCLFYRAPRLTSADDLLSLCYPADPPSIASLSVTVASVNRKAALIDPRPLIVNLYGKGYRLRQGIPN